jgi:hypothetical protein
MRISPVAASQVLALALAGCAQEPAPFDPYVTGTRLQPVVLEGSDGSRQFTGWFDTMRGEDCAFRLASDGTMRCLPAAAPASTKYFAVNAGECNRPVVLVPSCAMTDERPKYAAMPVGCGTSLGPLLLHVTDRLDAVDVAIFAPPNFCNAADPVTGFDFFGTGSSISPSEFVEGVVAAQ